jgi:excisionase family DNA binding protein
MKKYVSEAEFADMLGISRSTASRLIHSGLIEYVQVGRRICISIEAVQKYIAERTVAQSISFGLDIRRTA